MTSREVSERERSALLTSPSKSLQVDITSTAAGAAEPFEDLDFDNLNLTPSTFKYEDGT